MKDENGRPKGFGFVCYKNPQDAEKAVLAYADKGSMYVGEAKTKEKRI
jgi:RNA recognition motif-containing protein